MADMEARAGGIGKHVERVELRLFAAGLARIGGAERAVSQPELLPGRLERREGELLAHLHNGSPPVNYTAPTMERKTLCIASRNVHKIEEMTAVLEPYWQVKSSLDYPELEEIEETGDTFLANASLKALATSQTIADYVLADDSGLEADALDGAPGVFSARYGGIPSSTEKNNEKLLQELTRVGAVTPQQRAARYRCVLALAKEGEILQTFDGVCEGTIAMDFKGTGGFGYDPLFIPQGYARTFGQLGPKTKANLSHRALALKQFVAWCKANPVEE
jgi:XTP/dITP diphosphohydrolase